MRAHVLVLAVYVALLAMAGTVGAYIIGGIIGRVVQGLGG